MSNGICAQIRAYLQRHDTATTKDLAAHIGASARLVGKACFNMAVDGRLERDGDGFRLGRLPDLSRKPPRGKVLEIKAQLPVQRAAIPAASVEEYLRAGGAVEKLPSEERPWTRYPRPGFSV